MKALDPRLWPLVPALALLLALTPARALTFSNWIAGYPTVTNTALNGDQDNDGIPNLTEFALADCDPTRVDSSTALPAMVFGTREGDSVIPWRDAGVIQPSDAAVPPLTSYFYIGLAYKPRANVEGIRLRPQYAWWASNLEAWLDGRSVFLAPVPWGTNGHVVSWVQGMFRPAAPPPKSYLRLTVEVAP